MFVREGRERWLQILKTPGVCRFVACAGRPVVIPFSEIEGVRRIVESTLSVEPHPFLRRGDCEESSLALSPDWRVSWFGRVSELAWSFRWKCWDDLVPS